jgi:hypothetical protein
MLTLNEIQEINEYFAKAMKYQEILETRVT